MWHPSIPWVYTYKDKEYLLLQSKKCVCNGQSILDLMKLKVHTVVLGNILGSAQGFSGTCNQEVMFNLSLVSFAIFLHMFVISISF